MLKDALQGVGLSRRAAGIVSTEWRGREGQGGDHRRFKRMCPNGDRKGRARLKLPPPPSHFEVCNVTQHNGLCSYARFIDI